MSLLGEKRSVCTLACYQRMSLLHRSGLYGLKSCSEPSLPLPEVGLSNDMLSVCMLPLAVALEVHPGEAPIEAAVLRQDERAAQSSAAELQHCDGLLLPPLHAPAGRMCSEPGAICLISWQMQRNLSALSASLGP